jgi:hypothetical protein
MNYVKIYKRSPRFLQKIPQNVTDKKQKVKNIKWTRFRYFRSDAALICICINTVNPFIANDAALWMLDLFSKRFHLQRVIGNHVLVSI